MSSYLIDSHCHLDFADFTASHDDIIARAHQADVGLMITIGTKLSQMSPILDLIAHHPSVYGTAGLHPNHVVEEAEITFEALLDFAENPKIVGFGETGLDAHYHRDDLIPQEHSFRLHIAASRRCNLPVVIHARNVDAEIERVLVDEMKIAPFKAVLHCFTAGRRLADIALELGLYISFSGIVTFKNATATRDIAQIVPHDRILVETDAPYLAPMPHRGKRNEPAYVAHTAGLLAELRGIDKAQMAAQSSANCLALFDRIDPAMRFKMPS